MVPLGDTKAIGTVHPHGYNSTFATDSSIFEVLTQVITYQFHHNLSIFKSLYIRFSIFNILEQFRVIMCIVIPVIILHASCNCIPVGV